MASAVRITYDPTTPFGQKVFAAVQAIRLAETNIQRAMQVANDVTAGANPVYLVNLEGSPEFGVKVGSGVDFFEALTALSAALFAVPATWTPPQAVIDLDLG